MIIPDEVIAERISKGRNAGECADLFTALLEDMDWKLDNHEFGYMAGRVQLTKFCLQIPQDVEAIDRWVRAMGDTCKILSIEDSGEYSSFIPTAKLYNITLVRPESPHYQRVHANQS